ncbi:MAG: DUF4249 domain-containing protein [Cytophagaceae bacterium]
MKAHILISFVIICTLSSCEKVIDVNLNEASPRIIVDGRITNLDVPDTIKLSRSGNYFGRDEFERIIGAEVVVADNAGNREVLQESAPGRYVANQLKGEPGRNYHLQISYGDETVQASSPFPHAVEIDSLTYRYRSGEFFLADGNYITLYFVIPEGITSYFLLRLKSDSIMYSFNPDNFILFTSEFFPDRKVEYEINQATFGLGQAEVELVSLTRQAYEFYSDLNSIRGNTGANPFTGVPENPKNNLSGGALGYFQVQAISIGSIVIEPLTGLP